MTMTRTNPSDHNTDELKIDTGKFFAVTKY